MDSELYGAGERDSTGYQIKVFTAGFPTVLYSSCFASFMMSDKQTSLIKQERKMKCLYLSSFAF